MPDAAYGGLPLRHRLEQTGLCFRRRPVDLVRKDDLMHDRALAVLKFAGLHIEDLGAHDIGRQCIGRELNPPEVAAD